MAPDVEELIKRVNTLTLDKNRLKQKLMQLTSGQGQKEASGRTAPTRVSSSSTSPLQTSRESSSESCDILSTNSFQQMSSPTNWTAQISPTKSSYANNSHQQHQAPPNLIAGVECATSCEEDILYMNDLYKKRLDEYDENWDFMQSKCSALLSELNTLQKHFIRLKRENLDLEEKYRGKCHDHDQIKSELQTVVLNYETQLSAMSEHLSSITSQISLEDDSPTRSIRNPNYTD